MTVAKTSLPKGLIYVFYGLCGALIVWSLLPWSWMGMTIGRDVIDSPIVSAFLTLLEPLIWLVKGWFRIPGWLLIGSVVLFGFLVQSTLKKGKKIQDISGGTKLLGIALLTYLAVQLALYSVRAFVLLLPPLVALGLGLLCSWIECIEIVKRGYDMDDDGIALPAAAFVAEFLVNLQYYPWYKGGIVGFLSDAMSGAMQLSAIQWVVFGQAILSITTIFIIVWTALSLKVNLRFLIGK